MVLVFPLLDFEQVNAGWGKITLAYNIATLLEECLTCENSTFWLAYLVERHFVLIKTTSKRQNSLMNIF